MSIFRRKTSRGETEEYHYNFMQGGKRYYGVCEGCTTERAALAFEKKIRDTAKTAAEQKSVKALIDNFREELTGGEAVSLAGAFDRYIAKPKKRIPSEHQARTNRTYWNDFTAFMAARYPEAVNLADVTDRHAEEYITMLRDSGAFVKEVTFTRKDGRRVIESTYTPRCDKLSPRTINARHKAIKAVFAWLKDDAGLARNPFDIPTLDNDTISRDAFTDAELMRIGDAMTMPYTQPIFTIGLCTGLTLGDICLLRWNEIEGGWISNKRRRKTGVMLDIPIMPPLAAFLDQQRPKTGGGEFVAPELAAIALTLCDQDTTVWLSPSLNEESVRRWFRFQCGAVLTDSPSGADFAFASRPEDMPLLADLSRGEPEYPDRSTTLCVGGVSFEQGEGSLSLTASGPGIEHPMPFYCNLPEEFTGRWEENHLAFPQGVDLFLCGRGMVAGLPRSTCLKAQKEETPCM